MMNASHDTKSIFARLDRMVQNAKTTAAVAAQAGAQVFYDETRARAPVSDAAHVFYGRNSKASGITYRFEPGNLRDSIYQYRLRDGAPEASGRASYVVSWNHRKAPYGAMVEFGTSQAPAQPFLRPSYDAAKLRAQKVSTAVLLAGLKGGVP